MEKLSGKPSQHGTGLRPFCSARSMKQHEGSKEKGKQLRIMRHWRCSEKFILKIVENFTGKHL